MILCRKGFVERPIKLDFCDMHNFGDALSKDIVAFLSGREVMHSYYKNADLIATGSIFYYGVNFFGGVFSSKWNLLRWVFHKLRNCFVPPLVVWGTGFLVQPRIPKVLVTYRALDVRAVRGQYTREILVKTGLLDSDAKVALGDPGLLFEKLVPSCRKAKKRYDIGIVPHYCDYERARMLEVCIEGLGINVKLINVRGPDFIQVIRDISESRKILSSSLHGLIVADSLGIPNAHVLFSDLGLNDQVLFKFKDYYSAYDLGLPSSMRYDKIMQCPESIFTDMPMETYVPKYKVDEVRERLLACFPYRSKV